MRDQRLDECLVQGLPFRVVGVLVEPQHVGMAAVVTLEIGDMVAFFSQLVNGSPIVVIFDAVAIEVIDKAAVADDQLQRTAAARSFGEGLYGVICFRRTLGDCRFTQV